MELVGDGEVVLGSGVLGDEVGEVVGGEVVGDEAGSLCAVDVVWLLLCVDVAGWRVLVLIVLVRPAGALVVPDTSAGGACFVGFGTNVPSYLVR